MQGYDIGMLIATQYCMRKDFNWVNNPELNESDRANLSYIKKLLEEGETEAAMHYATWNCDTMIRDAIPATVWKYMGGGLTPKGKERLLKEKGTIFFIVPKSR